MIRIFALTLLILTSNSALAVGEWPLRTLGIGSTFRIPAWAVPPINDPTTFQKAVMVTLHGSAWTSKKPYCTLENGDTAVSPMGDDIIFKLVSIEGQYFPEPIDFEVNHPQFESKLLLQSDKGNLLWIKCSNYKKDAFGEMTIDQMSKSFGKAVTPEKLILETPGGTARSPIDKDYNLDLKALENNIRVEFDKDFVLTKDTYGGYLANLQDGDKLKQDEVFAIDQKYCQLFMNGEENDDLPETYTIPKGSISGLGNVDSYYGKGQLGMTGTPGRQFNGTLIHIESPAPIELTCTNPNSNTYHRYDGLGDITRNFISWNFEL